MAIRTAVMAFGLSFAFLIRSIIDPVQFFALWHRTCLSVYWPPRRTPGQRAPRESFPVRLARGAPGAPPTSPYTAKQALPRQGGAGCWGGGIA